MPELPEVEIVGRGIAASALGRCFARVEVRRTDLRVPVPADLAAVLEGRRAERLARRGKYILLYIAGGAVMILHLGMAGRVRIYRPGQDYAPEKHDHAVFDLSDGGRIVYNDPRRFGMIRLGTEDGWERDAPFRNMGPEPLGSGFSGAALLERLRGRATAIKAALLDQRVVAGIGNIYACEALFAAGIDPARRSDALSGPCADALAAALKDVLIRAIEAGGSTLKDYRQTDGALGYFQYGFSVYDREGTPCPGCDCGGGVRRIVQSGRSTFYCGKRQV